MKVAKLKPISPGANAIEAVLDLPDHADLAGADLKGGHYVRVPQHITWPLVGTLYNPNFWASPPQLPYELTMILIHYNEEPWRLRIALDAQVTQAFPRDRFEVIVADDGTPGGVAGVVGPYESRLNVRVVTNPRTDPAEIRNCNVVCNSALATARGKTVLLHSSHIVPCRTDFHSTLAGAIGISKGRIATSLVMLDQNATDATKLRGVAALEPMYDALVTSRRYYQSPETTKIEDWLRIGGFDQVFLGWGGEDDLARRRLDRVGVRIDMQKATLKMVHLYHPRRTTEQAINSMRTFLQINARNPVMAIHDLPPGVTRGAAVPPVELERLRENERWFR